MVIVAIESEGRLGVVVWDVRCVLVVGERPWLCLFWHALVCCSSTHLSNRTCQRDTVVYELWYIMGPRASSP